MENIGKEIGGAYGRGKKQISVSLELVMLVDSILLDEEIRERRRNW